MHQHELDCALADGNVGPVRAISRFGSSRIHPGVSPHESDTPEADTRTADLAAVEADRVALAIQA